MISRLKTAAQIADRRIFERRMDPAAYHCEKAGNNWFAYGPTNVFQYRLETPGDGGTVLCVSCSGQVYRLTQDEATEEYHCDCPAAAKAENPGTCKHNTGLAACLMTARMNREIGGAA